MEDLGVLPHLYDGLVMIFSKDYEEMVQKAEKKRKAKDIGE